MSDYTDDTFESIWSFDGIDGETYTVLRNALTDTFHVHRSQDIEEKSYYYLVKKTYQRINGTLSDLYDHFVIAMDNTLHSDTGPAACIPCGLSGFRPREDVTNYLLYGKIMSQYSWLTWIKETVAWPKAMANLLGSKQSC
jgi:hypothetical protein